MRSVATGLFSSVVALAIATTAYAGPYTDAGIPSSSPLIQGWATSITLTRGPQNIANPTGPLASYGSPDNALGPANGSVVSLGDAGIATLTFATPIVDGPGPDFAVFENAFVSGGGVFAELAFVEVSSDGIDFVRFPSISLTPTTTQVGSFGTIDPTNVYNLAGKHVSGQGTGFDLAELVGLSDSLNLSSITHVRLIDVVGSINPSFGLTDSVGNLVNDAYPTAFASGGFDLDAVAVLNIPEPTLGLFASAAMALVCVRRRA